MSQGNETSLLPDRNRLYALSCALIGHVMFTKSPKRQELQSPEDAHQRTPSWEIPHGERVTDEKGPVSVCTY